jgi:hypothetical protein
MPTIAPVSIRSSEVPAGLDIYSSGTMATRDFLVTGRGVIAATIDVVAAIRETDCDKTVVQPPSRR